MAIPLPADVHFYIEHSTYDASYEMPTMEASGDHFEIGYILSGDRLTITPTGSYVLHAGDVGTMPPYIYHRTLPSSDAPYERYLVKFRPDLVRPLTEAAGQNVLEEICAPLAHRFESGASRRIRLYFEEMHALYTANARFGSFRIQCMLCDLLLAVLDNRLLPEDEAALVHAPLTPPIIDAVCYMEQHYHEDPSLETVALLCGYSPSHFSRLFHAQLGKPFSAYLTGIRLRHVQDLLLNTDRSITDIALETGYAHTGNLSSQFRQLTGMTPLQYRKAHRR